MKKNAENNDGFQNAIRPIIFSTPMVKAILSGDKTMTRRTKGLDIINKDPSDWQFEWADFILKKPWRFTQLSSVNEHSLKERNFNQAEIECPYGRIGDSLWVRETFMPCVTGIDDGGLDQYGYLFKADGKMNDAKIEQMEDQRWKPSIHMPFAAARIFLQITNIRVERVTDISDEDCLKEGISMQYLGWKRRYSFPDCFENFMSPKTAFNLLWEYVNGPGSWDANPWVWVIEFRRVEL